MKGTLETMPLPRGAAMEPPDPSFACRNFRPIRRRRRGDARSRRADAFGVALLDGVTGSGKTEVYFEAVAEALKRGRQVLILMPEIALTGQFLDRFSRASACVRWNGIRN
jgi:primosomal protein N' (replication factor Y)